MDVAGLPSSTTGPAGRQPRLLFDLTGLLHWYGYFRRPAGVQRMIEQVGGCAVLQEAARDGSRSARRVEFVVRLVGTDRFLRLDPRLLVDLSRDRGRTVDRLRQLFAQSLRRTPVATLAWHGRYFHLPYWLRGLLPAGGGGLVEVAPPQAGDAFVSPGDLWWQKGYAAAIGGLQTRTGVRVLQVVHDLLVEARSDWSPGGFSRVFADELRGIAPHVDRWLTPSQAVREDLAERLRRWSMPARPIIVYPQGWDSFGAAAPGAASDDRGVLARHGLSGQPYMLFVGTIEPRKNVSGLLDAVETLRTELGDRVPRLVIVGGYGWRSGALRRRLEAGHRAGHVAWLQNLDDATLAALYRGARFTVMPSLGEGYGLAIQESLGHGTPCIANDGAAMREAGRDLAVYVDAAQPAALAAAIRDWVVDPAALTSARDTIRRWLSTNPLATWNDAAKVILAAAAADNAA